MIDSFLTSYKIILASNSPRRKQFLTDLKIPFEVKTANIDEVYPDHLVKGEITDYLAKLKAAPLEKDLKDNQILITSDTIVWHNDTALGKPVNEAEAFSMLSNLSGTNHQVISSVCLTTKKQQLVESVTTEVTFKDLTPEEINYYIANYQPFDKAGAYGIQEWIGYIGITSIAGSYNNVVGLPTAKFYELLKKLV
ncbi:Maf-like protein [Neptunitalea chrysea]|uniref:dTTP/UTP pyrophosphatase n=1 Tax=Neptunitalea chrysea TaxID=1647581 RepID=A0A9W6EUI8_9FLAO|nr:Maf-like protein [Neptunitalea chrysea]GLB51382.1 Maf-like protein [Neptunitalea chrysea]